jgi:Na+-transporting methylmalonyl-CoA/oxaloacetate decarboxylase beta subunit
MFLCTHLLSSFFLSITFACFCAFTCSAVFLEHLLNMLLCTHLSSFFCAFTLACFCAFTSAVFFDHSPAQQFSCAFTSAVFLSIHLLSSFSEHYLRMFLCIHLLSSFSRAFTKNVVMHSSQQFFLCIHLSMFLCIHLLSRFFPRVFTSACLCAFTCSADFFSSIYLSMFLCVHLLSRFVSEYLP